MDKEVEVLSKFLSDRDQKIFRAVIRDPIAFEVLKKLFEDPDNAEKYLILIRDNVHAIFIAARLAESIGRHLDEDDEEKCLNIFLRSLSYLDNFRDRKTAYDVFEIVREAVESRIVMKKYESASKLLSIFQNLGLKNCLKKLVFHAMEVADSGDHARAVRILDLLPNCDEVLSAKAYVLVEWGKKLSASNPEEALRMIEEALKIQDVPSARVIMAEIFENLGNYEKAYEIYKAIKNQPSIEKRLARLLMEWGEESKDLKKLEEAKFLAANDPVMLEEIERRIRKIKC
uniref:Tetratricopeptide repeat protein n=1 Tax=Archaeoglobus fulgidus TaxID=2234 RepID=A0A7J2TI42_ARCFL